MREDWLLKRYSAKGSEAAFAELVRRHLDFVYSVCRRQVGDPELAQDITQTVFLVLAAKSSSLKPGTVLRGWLFQTAHHACQNALRSEARRRHYEQKAAKEMEHSASFAASGLGGEPPQAEPLLDDALAQLNPADRNAVLLRYGEDMSPEEMGIALGISAAAAQKRVSRALERLHRRLAQAGTVLSVAALGLLLKDTLAQAAPPAASAAILAAVKSGFSGAGSGAIGTGTALRQFRLGQFSRPAPIVKASALVAAALVGGVLLAGVMLHGKTAQTPSAKSAPVPETIIALGGTVVNADGSPAAGVVVYVVHSAAPDGAESLFAEAQTDPSGRYHVSGPGSALDQWSVTADSGSRLGVGVPGAPCVLLPPTRLRLHFVGAAGQPVPNLSVQLLLLTRTTASGQPETASLAVDCPKRLILRSDRLGNATFAGLPQGCSVSFAVLDAGYERRPPQADGLALGAQADSGTQAVTVMRGAAVAGRLVYAGSGLPAAGVRIGAQETGTAAWGEAQTDTGGGYMIRQLSPGRYTIAVDEESGPLDREWTAAAVPGVTLEPGQTVSGADMSLVRGILITGTVTAQSNHHPVAGTEIGTYGPAHPAAGAWVSGGWTGADGTYQIRVPPGAQHVYPMAFPGAGGADITVRTGQRAVVDFAVPAP